MEVDGVARIGRRDGSASRRELTRSHAKKMVEIREAKRAALKASGRRGDLYSWTGTRLGGRPGAEIGDRGKPWPARNRKQLKPLLKDHYSNIHRKPLTMDETSVGEFKWCGVSSARERIRHGEPVT